MHEQLLKVYEEHNASKLGEVDNLIAKPQYVGKELELYQKVCKKYGVQPAQYESTTPDTKPLATAGAIAAPLLGGDVVPAAGTGSLFGSSPFGGASSSIFGAASPTNSASSGSALFGSSPFGGSAFGGGGGGLFAAASSSSTPFGTSSFGNAAAGGSLFGGGSTAVGGGGFGTPQSWVREQLLKVYSLHNASKLSEVDNLLAKPQYAGKELELYHKVCKKYGVQPAQYEGAAGAVTAPVGGLAAGAAPSGGEAMMVTGSSTSLFGAPSGFGALGGGAFGAASSGSTPFGASPFGAAAGGSPFGGGPAAGGGGFGAPPASGGAAGAFGSPAAFGGGLQGGGLGGAPGGNPFGGGLQGFGASPFASASVPAANPFGASAASASPFAAAPAPAFGSPSPLGAVGSAFGGGAGPFGGPSSGGSPFGGAAAGSSVFGGGLPLAGGGFAALAAQAQPQCFGGCSPSPSPFASAPMAGFGGGNAFGGGGGSAFGGSQWTQHRG